MSGLSLSGSPARRSRRARLTAGVVACSAVVAATAGGSPTGAPVLDDAWQAVTAGAVTYLAVWASPRACRASAVLVLAATAGSAMFWLALAALAGSLVAMQASASKPAVPSQVTGFVVAQLAMRLTFRARR